MFLWFRSLRARTLWLRRIPRRTFSCGGCLLSLQILRVVSRFVGRKKKLTFFLWFAGSKSNHEERHRQGLCLVRQSKSETINSHPCSIWIFFLHLILVKFFTSDAGLFAFLLVGIVRGSKHAYSNYIGTVIWSSVQLILDLFPFQATH